MSSFIASYTLTFDIASSGVKTLLPGPVGKAARLHDFTALAAAEITGTTGLLRIGTVATPAALGTYTTPATSAFTFVEGTLSRTYADSDAATVSPDTLITIDSDGANTAGQVTAVLYIEWF